LGDGVFVIKKLDIRFMLEESIEKAKCLDHENL
jgi:hypothetical protein